MLKEAFIFVSGLVVGSVVTWSVVKNTYEKYADEEIESVKERYYEKEKEFEDREEMNNIISENKYNQKSEEVKDLNKRMPYIITPEEFDDGEYRDITLNYYKDGVVTDFYDRVVDNYEELIGNDFMNHFGEYEDDSVFVRNDERQIDYEVLLNDDNYKDLYSSSSAPKEE